MSNVINHKDISNKKCKMKNIYSKYDINIINADCFDFMDLMINEGRKVNLIITSPPYNTSRRRGTWSKGQKSHYDLPSVDKMSDAQYMDWTIDLFRKFDGILCKDGVILYNLSYSTDKPYQMWEVIGSVMDNTNFKIADTIIWKKSSALPNNMSHNRITRICEFIFVFARESELKSFKMNKEVLSVRPNGIKQYTNYYNFIEARNNDGSTPLNKATFSSDLVTQLLTMYYVDGVVYDPFMGTGTTAVACLDRGVPCIGTELSLAQCEYSSERLIKMISGDA